MLWFFEGLTVLGKPFFISTGIIFAAYYQNQKNENTKQENSK